MKTETPTPVPIVRAQTRPTRAFGRRTRDVLSLAWLHGSLHAAVLRKQSIVASWECQTPVNTLEEFEPALDEAIAALRFAGEDVFLVLAHDKFVHQTEQAPAFSESASRSYLRGRVDRYEKEHEPVLWVSQRTVSVRQEAAFLLHLLPSAFYGRLNSMLLVRRLDLTRILPLTVPLQLMLETLEGPGEKPLLVATETGGATTVIAARPDGELLFARTILARWDTDPARLGVEVNRSLLYAKQQFGAVIDHIWLLGGAAEQQKTEVQTRCGAGKEINVRATTPLDWLQTIAKLTPRHPVNLVAGYLGRKRRLQFVRRALIAGCWLGFGLLALDTWNRVQTWSEESRRLHGLRANESALHAEKARLEKRNTEADARRRFIREAVDDRLPPVPAKFLAYLGSVLPPSMSLSDCSVKWDPASATWSFRLEGQIDGDEDTARETLSSFQRGLTKGVLRIRFADGVRTLVPVPAAGGELPVLHRFSVEGGFFES
jgi:hypothetical protein